MDRSLPSKTFYCKKKSIRYLNPLERKAIRLLKQDLEASAENRLAEEGGDMMKKKVKSAPRCKKHDVKKLRHSSITNRSKFKSASHNISHHNVRKSLKMPLTCSWAPKSLTKKYLNCQSDYRKSVHLSTHSIADALQMPLSSDKICEVTRMEADHEVNKENVKATIEESSRNAPTAGQSFDVKLQSHVSQVKKTTEEQTCKLFPIFTKERSGDKSICDISSKLTKKLSPKVSPKAKSADAKSPLQYIIDAGQKKFGAIQCSTCGMVYTASHPGDEHEHARYHKKFLAVIKFPGWKSERVVDFYMDGRVIKVTTADPQYSVKKVTDVLGIVDVDLGFIAPNLGFSSTKVAYLFISDQEKIVGCLIAEKIDKAFRLIYDKDEKPNDIFGDGLFYTDSNPVAAVCGVSRIWTYAPMRRNKVATRLVDCLRASFVLGMTLNHSQVAFSDPTPDGRRFAFNYFNTKNILVYNLLQ